MAPFRSPRVDPELERVARRLRALELVADPDDGERPQFADFYSEAGLRTALDAYGVAEALGRRGLADWKMRIERDDPFHHRLVLHVGDDPEAMDARITDLRLHLCRIALRGEEPRWDAVVVEWLLMQDPRAPFTKERPRLPGQAHPGTGMGRIVHDLLVLMTRRLARDALLNIPERPHLVELYLRAGWRFVDGARAVPVRAALDAAAHLPYPHRAWAFERGFVKDEDGAPYVHEPLEMILPVSDALQDELARDDGVLARLVRSIAGPREPRYRVDEDALFRSLVEDPVEGLDPTW